jgi:tetratricopeptide (TPR) repeat protein
MKNELGVFTIVPGKMLLLSMVLLALQSASASISASASASASPGASISHRTPWVSMPIQKRSFATRKRSSHRLLAVDSLRGGGANTNSNEVDEDEETDEDEGDSNVAESSGSNNGYKPPTLHNKPPTLQGKTEVSPSSETTNEKGQDEDGDEATPVPVVVLDSEMEETEEEESSSEAETAASAINASQLPTVVETTTTTVLDDVAEEESSENNDATTKNNNAAEEQEEDWTEQDQEIILEQASVLRLAGKDLHDEGNFDEAADSFGAAANLLTPLLTSIAENDDNNDDDSDLWTEEFATCRLHEALCRLKAEQYDQAAAACSDVLGLQGDSVAPALRARAFHRRAKAQLELGDAAAALQDARSASFLGDRKAVALYGKLMRESSPGSSSSSSSSSSIMSQVGGTSNADNLASSSALLESLLNKSSGGSPSSLGGGSTGGGLPFSPLSLLNMGQAAGGGEGQGNLAKSVLLSLSKRLEDEDTQDTICQYLQGTSGPQLQQMASMAGMQLQKGQAAKLASICNGVTPKTIRFTVKTTKRAIYGVQLIRKIMKLVAKYRNILVLLVLLAWIKSAYLRPIPINKKAARRAVKEAAKLATAAM